MLGGTGNDIRYFDRKAIVRGTEVLQLGGQMAPTLANFTRALVASPSGQTYLGPVWRASCNKLVEQFEQYGTDWYEAASPGHCVGLLNVSNSNVLRLAHVYRYLARGEAFALDLAAKRKGLAGRIL